MLSERCLIELVYLDASGSSGAVSVSIPVTSTVSEAEASASALASVLASLTGCVLVRQRIKYIIVRDPSTPAALGSSIKRCGALFYTTVPEAPDAIVVIPGINSDVFLTDGCMAGIRIDATNAGITAFTDALIANGATNIFADAISGYFAGMLESRV